MTFLRVMVIAGVLVLFGSACNSNNCEEAAEIFERCGSSSNSNNGTNGVTVTTNDDFDVNACEDSDQQQDYADCVVENEDNICNGDGSALLGCAFAGLAQ